jgi:flagellar export protein FliJ
MIGRASEMAFTFRYESLLVYRNYLKEKAERDLARAMGELSRAEQGLADLVQDRGRAAAELEADLGTPMDASLMRSTIDYLSNMADKIRAQATKVKSQETAVRQERQKLLSKIKEYRIMENLKEKDRAKWMMEQERRESIRLNEIALLRHRNPQT